MLRARTEEQKKKVLEIFGIQETCCHFPLDFDKETEGGYEEYDDRIYLDGNITFDKMLEAVEYLRKENEEVEIPTTCRVSADSDGVVYDLRETPHNEVMQFCKKLAWVKGGNFDIYYGQYVKTGRIRL
jgi:hypothetical protein